jgi:hypothetical protein
MTTGIFANRALEEIEELRYEAQAQGYTFLKIRLNPRMVRNKDMRLAGVKVARGFASGEKPDGTRKIDFLVTGGLLQFQFDRVARTWMAYLLDDKDRGAFSDKGYNRDFLASHLVNSAPGMEMFIIDEDKEVIADIKDRMERLSKRMKDKEETEKSIRLESLDEIDKELDELSQKKQRIMESTKDVEPVSALPKVTGEAAIAPHRKAGRPKREESAIGNHETTGQLA